MQSGSEIHQEIAVGKLPYDYEIHIFFATNLSLQYLFNRNGFRMALRSLLGMGVNAVVENWYSNGRYPNLCCPSYIVRFMEFKKLFAPQE